MHPTNQTPQTNNTNSNKTLYDVLFYSGITILGVGLTSLFLYGYRKFNDENMDNLEIVDGVTVLHAEQTNFEEYPIPIPDYEYNEDLPTYDY